MKTFLVTLEFHAIGNTSYNEPNESVLVNAESLEEAKCLVDGVFVRWSHEVDQLNLRLLGIVELPTPHFNQWMEAKFGPPSGIKKLRLSGPDAHM
jgi:hypothetical protein